VVAAGGRGYVDFYGIWWVECLVKYHFLRLKIDPDVLDCIPSSFSKNAQLKIIHFSDFVNGLQPIGSSHWHSTRVNVQCLAKVINLFEKTLIIMGIPKTFDSPLPNSHISFR
jgi:hypothetical protein